VQNYQYLGKHALTPWCGLAAITSVKAYTAEFDRGGAAKKRL